MTLDSASRRNLELTETLSGAHKGSLLHVLDHTVTPMGKRLLYQWISQPLLEVDKIQSRLDGVGYFFDRRMERAELREALKPLADLERLANRIMAGHAQPRDLVALRETLGRLPDIKELVERGKTIEAGLPAINLHEDELRLLEILYR